MVKWGKAEWIRGFWRRHIPYPEPYSLRQVFYQNLPKIQRFVQSKNKMDNPKWADYFYNDLCRILSDLVLDGELSYRELNLKEGGGRSNLIWQDFVFEEARPPIGNAFAEYPLEVWVENNSTYNSVEPLMTWRVADQKADFQINLVSMRGFQSTQLIEDAYLDRREDLEVILCLTDFDPSGVEMPFDIQRRFKRIGVDVEVKHIGILPEQIPKERRSATLIHYKRKDPRSKRFMERYGAAQLAHEIQALNPPEIRELIRTNIISAIQEKGWEKRIEPIG